MPEYDPRVFFAAERTLLAWVRTGLGLVGMGFVVAKFGCSSACSTRRRPTTRPRLGRAGRRGAGGARSAGLWGAVVAAPAILPHAAGLRDCPATTAPSPG